MPPFDAKSKSERMINETAKNNDERLEATAHDSAVVPNHVRLRARVFRAVLKERKQ